MDILRGLMFLWLMNLWIGSEGTLSPARPLWTQRTNWGYSCVLVSVDAYWAPNTLAEEVKLYNCSKDLILFMNRLSFCRFIWLINDSQRIVCCLCEINHMEKLKPYFWLDFCSGSVYMCKVVCITGINMVRKWDRKIRVKKLKLRSQRDC